MKSFIYTLALLLLTGMALPLSGQDFGSVELKNVNGEVKPVASYAQGKAMVLIFTGVHCVYAKKYEDRILALVEEYREKEVSFVLVNSNDPEVSYEDSFERMAEHAQEKHYTFPYLEDHEQILADSVGATKTPEAFIYALPADSGRMELFYHGPIDDNPLLASRVQHPYLKEALDALLAGEEAPASNALKGCSIKRMD